MNPADLPKEVKTAKLLQPIIRCNDLAQIKKHMSTLSHLMGTNHAASIAIQLSYEATLASVEYENNEKTSMLELLFSFPSFRAVVTTESISYRVIEHAWDVGALAAVRFCLKQGMVPYMYRHSKWIRNHYASMLKADELLNFESFTVMMNLVHVTFPHLPPVMSAFTSNTHMSKIEDLSRKSEDNVLYGLFQEVDALIEEEAIRSKDDKETVRSTLQMLLFVVSYLYTEVVVFDAETPNWVAWDMMLQVAPQMMSSTGKSRNNGSGGNSAVTYDVHLQRCMNKVVDMVIDRFETMMNKVEPHLRSHCAMISAMRANPKTAKKALVLEMADVTRVVARFRDLLRCLRFTLTRCTRGQVSNEDTVYELIGKPLRVEYKDALDEFQEAEAAEEEDEEEKEAAEEAAGEEAQEEEERELDLENDNEVAQVVVEGDGSATTSRRPAISFMGIRILTLLAMHRQDKAPLYNQNVDGQFVMQQTSLSIANVLKSRTLCILGYLMAEYRFEPSVLAQSIIQKHQEDAHYAKFNAPFKSFKFVFDLFNKASHLAMGSESDAQVGDGHCDGDLTLEQRVYYWLGRMNVRGDLLALSEEETAELLLLLETLVQSSLEDHHQRGGAETSTDVYVPVLLTRWYYRMHIALTHGSAEQCKYARHMLLKIMFRELDRRLQNTRSEACGILYLSMYALVFVIFGPMTVTPEMELLEAKIDGCLASNDLELTIDNIHRTIQLKFAQPLLQLMSRDVYGIEDLTKHAAEFHAFKDVPCVRDWLSVSVERSKHLFTWMERTTPAFSLTDENAIKLFALRFSQGPCADEKEHEAMLRWFRTATECTTLYGSITEVVARVLQRGGINKGGLPIHDFRDVFQAIVPNVFLVLQRLMASEANGRTVAQIQEDCLQFLRLCIDFPTEGAGLIQKHRVEESGGQDIVRNFIEENPETNQDSIFTRVCSYFLTGCFHVNGPVLTEMITAAYATSAPPMTIHPCVFDRLEGEKKDDRLTLEMVCAVADEMHALTIINNEEEDTGSINSLAPLRISAPFKAEQWFRLAAYMIMQERNQKDQVQVRTRLPAVVAHLCNAIRYELLDWRTIYSQFYMKHPGVWLRLALLPATAEFARTVFFEEDSTSHFVSFFLHEAGAIPPSWHLACADAENIKETRWNYTRAPPPMKRRHLLHMKLRHLKNLTFLLRSFMAAKFEYTMYTEKEAFRFLSELFYRGVQALRPIVEDVEVRVRLMKNAFLFHQGCKNKCELYPPGMRRVIDKYNLDELFSRKYAVDVSGPFFMQWAVGNENEAELEASVSGRMPIDRFLLKVLLTEVNSGRLPAATILQFAENNPYNAEFAPVVCRLLSRVFNQPPKAHRDASLFYFWARDLLVLPNQLLEVPSSLLVVGKEEEPQGVGEEEDARMKMVLEMCRVEFHLATPGLTMDEKHSATAAAVVGAPTFLEVKQEMHRLRGDYETHREVKRLKSLWEKEREAPDRDDVAHEVGELMMKADFSGTQSKDRTMQQLIEEARANVAKKYRSQGRKTKFSFHWL